MLQAVSSLSAHEIVAQAAHHCRCSEEFEFVVGGCTSCLIEMYCNGCHWAGIAQSSRRWNTLLPILSENLHCMWLASKNLVAKLTSEKLNEDARTLYWGSVATEMLEREYSDSFPISVCGMCLPHACMCRRAGGRELSKTFSRRLIWRDLAYWQLHYWPHMAVRPMRTHYSEQVIYFASPPVFPLVTPSYHLCGQPYLPHSPTDRF